MSCGTYIIFHRYHRTCSMSRHSCHVAMKHVTLKRAYGILRRRATVWVEPVICHSYYMSQVLYVTHPIHISPLICHTHLTSDMSHTSRLWYVTHLSPLICHTPHSYLTRLLYTWLDHDLFIRATTHSYQRIRTLHDALIVAWRIDISVTQWHIAHWLMAHCLMGIRATLL